MRTMIKVACLAVVAAAGVAHGQTHWHADGRGYTMRSGNTVFNQRSPGYGTSSTHIYSGNAQFHSYDNGTQGTTQYMPQGRYDNFSNPRQGWSGNGYTPYQNQYGSPYDGYGSGYRRFSY